MKATLPIPIDRVLQVLRYEPYTGIFYWKMKISDKTVVGNVAGSSKGSRAVRISIDGVLYHGHRLAWAMMTGQQPPALIDHDDLDDRNNRWGNLRESTYSQNGANRRVQLNSKTGTKGVHFYGNRKSPWLARLSCAGRVKLNRYFKTEQDAAAAYAAAAKQHFGEFARST